MARPGITYDQVADAADNIIAAGDRPTIQSIRATLDTGSANTIHRHLKNKRPTTRPVVISLFTNLLSEVVKMHLAPKIVPLILEGLYRFRK